jgi:hypothetical protein
VRARLSADLCGRLLNDRVLPLFESNDVKLLRVLTDRGSEFAAIRSGTNTKLYLAIRGHRLDAETVTKLGARSTSLSNV